MATSEKNAYKIEMNENAEWSEKDINEHHTFGARDKDGALILNDDGFQTDEESLPHGVCRTIVYKRCSTR